MKLGSKDLSNPTNQYVIAEVGVNHEGNLDTAFKLVEEAKSGGADAVKFQTYKAETIAAPDAKPYWDRTEETTESQFELFKKYDGFGPDEYRMIYEHCMKIGIDFSSTPFDLDAVEWLDEMVPFYKIASADITNFPLIRAIAKKSKPILLSTGASTVEEIGSAIRELENFGNDEICIMHCVLNYPTEAENANLRMIQGLSKIFPTNVIGYSDHTRPDARMLTLTSAVILGAQVIEKHFTLDKFMEGNDHYHSMDRSDLKIFIENLSALNPRMGSESKHFLNSEVPARENARRSLHYVRNVTKGEILKDSDFIALRPATGIPPSEIDKFTGKALKFDRSKLDRVLVGDVDF